MLIGTLDLELVHTFDANPLLFIFEFPLQVDKINFHL